MARIATRREVLAATLLALLAFVLVSEIGRRHALRGDWTRSRRYTLTERTRAVLASVREPVFLTLVLALVASPETPEEVVVTQIVDDVEELVRAFARACPRLRVATVDAFRDPARARGLLKRFRIRLPNVILIERAAERRVVGLSRMAQLGRPPRPGQPPPVLGFRGEEALATALLGVTAPRRDVAYVTGGHGERSVEDAGSAGLLALDRMLRRAGFRSRTFDGTAGQEIPADATLVVAPGPRTAFAAREARALERFLDRGGALLLLLDPRFEGGAPVPTGLERLLAGRGLRLGRDLIRDPANAFPFVPDDTFVVRDLPAHPISRTLGDLRLVVARARAVEGGATLLRTSARARRAPAPGEPASGPARAFPLGAASVQRGRMVVLGDSDLAANAQLENAGNREFLMRAANWLVRAEKRLDIPTRPVAEVRLAMTASELRVALWLIFVVLPGGAATAGLTLLFSRRRRQ